jgi:hypothetical protein
LIPPPHTLGDPPPPHVCGGAQVPQSTTPPHPSAIGPQFAPACWHVRGVHGGAPHWFAVPPPPHVLSPVQSPQLAVRPPQPSAT